MSMFSKTATTSTSVSNSSKYISEASVASKRITTLPSRGNRSEVLDSIDVDLTEKQSKKRRIMGNNEAL